MKFVTVLRRELRNYFASPVSYLLAFGLLLMGGLVFNNDLALRNGTDITTGVVILRFYAQFLLIFAPLITMRLFAEENREGTMEVLMTLPVRDSDLVIGKFLGAWAYFTILLFLSLVYQIALVWLSPPDLGETVAAYIGLWLLSGAAIAIGVLFSALNENQIVAAFFSIAVLLLLWQVDQIGTVINNQPLAELIRTFSFQTHYYYTFAIGLVRLDDVLFFISIITVCLFVTVQIVESRRWR